MSSVNPSSILLACCLLTLSGCRSPIIGPTTPSGYRVILPAASQTVRLQPLSLTIRITDANGAPVDGVPVHFRILQKGTALAEVDPPTVKTRHGQATTAFRARSAGHVAVEITVEDLTKTMHIAVVGETPRF